MKQVSMQMIADALDISKNSVSQALRDAPGVSEETKKLVRSKADELGYKYVKQNKRIQGEFLILATEFALSQVSFFGEIIKSIDYNCTLKNFKTTTLAVTSEMIQENQLPANLTNYSGIFIVSHITDDYISNIVNQGIPCVVVDHHSPKVLTDCVLTKNTDGAYSAVEFLIKHHCKKIGFIGDIDFSPSYLERFRGYQRALKEHDIDLDSKILITKIKENQAELFSKLKEIKQMPDAWFCVNSGLAYILNYYLQSDKYQIPEDISIICFDNTEFTQMSNPKITNISTDLSYMGKQAVITMSERLAVPDSPYIHKQILPQLLELGTVHPLNI
ncbi:MAG: LacI family DNA-binding transcriptional regulator [Streptococcaceae bacterium]|nr:LacI family DNA-binding transcriptional regulator [Streptococcaceae bacterium]